MSLSAQATRGALWTFLEGTAQYAIDLGFFIALARILEPRDFGITALAWALLALPQGLLARWAVIPLIQREDLEETHLNSAFWFNLAASCFLCVIVFLAADLIASVFTEPTLSLVIKWMAPTIVVRSLVQIYLAHFRRTMDFRALAIQAVAAAVIGGIVGVGMALENMGVFSLVGRELARGAVALAILALLCAWRPAIDLSRKHFKDIFDVGKHLVLSGIVNLAGATIVVPSISYFLGPIATGIYHAGNRFSGALSSVNAFAIHRATLSTFSRAQSDPERLRRGFYKTIEFASLVSFPVFLGFSAVAPEFTLTVMGEKWAEAIPLIQIIVLAGAAKAINTCSESLILARAKTKWTRNVDLIVLVVFLCLLFAALNYGLVAVALAVLAQQCIRMPIIAYLAHRLTKYDIKTFLRFIMTALVGCLLMNLSIVFVRQFTEDLLPIVALIVLIFAGAVTYGIVMLVIARSSIWSLFEHLKTAAFAGKQNR